MVFADFAQFGRLKALQRDIVALSSTVQAKVYTSLVAASGLHILAVQSPQGLRSRMTALAPTVPEGT